MQGVKHAYPWGGGAGRWYDPPAVWPLTELELRGKDERVARDETKPTIPDF